jgi:uncharacterized glyoxalase superfamily protein PhnB
MTTTLFHSLSFADVPAAIAFLEAVGFTKKGLHTDDSGVEPEGWVDPTGHAECYCVVETDAEVDVVYTKAVAAGGTSVRAPEDQDYGGRCCTVRDPEGNQWSFGSYQGE